VAGGSKKGKVVAVFVVAAALAGAGVFIFRDGEKLGSQREEAAHAAVPAPVDPPKVDPPKVDPAKVDPPKVAVPTTVTVRLESEPAGANVVDDASGGTLGVTPLVLHRPRGGSLKVRLEKEGYAPNARALSLDDDQTIDLTLEHKQPSKAPHGHKSHGSSGDEPAKL
jgi:hypothetical protein